MPKHLLFLVLAIMCEVAGTTALAASNQFTRLAPSIFAVCAYGLSFYFLSFTLKFMPVGIVYAVWSGLGIVGIGILGYLIWGQKLDIAAIAGMTMIIAGVLVINLFSNSVNH